MRRQLKPGVLNETVNRPLKPPRRIALRARTQAMFVAEIFPILGPRSRAAHATVAFVGIVAAASPTGSARHSADAATVVASRLLT